MLRHDGKRYHDVISLSIGRHTDIEESSICTRAAKKEVLMCIDDADPVLIVRVVCDECGPIVSARIEPDEFGVLLDEEEDNE